MRGKGRGVKCAAALGAKEGVSRSSSSCSPAPKCQKKVQGGDKCSSSKRKRRGESSSSSGDSGSDSSSDSDSNSNSDSDSDSDSGSICVQRRGGVRGGFVEGPNGTLLKNWPTGDEQLLPPVLAAADPGKGKGKGYTAISASEGS